MKVTFQVLCPQAVALALLCLGLATPSPSVARQQLNPTRQAEPAAGLRVIITPLADLPVVRVRYESAHYGSVRLELRNERGQVLYSELMRYSRFAGDFDLAAYPAGNYTIALQTPGDQYTQTVRLGRLSPVVVTLVTP
ncbi:hypothetical protein FNT36_16810 [Hymenobacter setariae]|uniref:T9SS type A sorting domain-containing protein n=1 Tax=Hymenobacter setariae TaxID=2594794 RepID=A0A558BS16_9BACT|nr:hypothetical protein [Hymenobacter setariae]TVT39316.1 hypothetical protein FNT36_16810 [Hymenobacter setariae]